MTNKCNCCGKVKELRLGFCWECVECESVIADGTDMRDNQIPKNDSLSSNMNKLKFILDKFKLSSNNKGNEQTNQLNN